MHFAWGFALWAVACNAHADGVRACPHCGWAPPAANSVLEVGSVAELRSALEHALPKTAILLRDGTYLLDGPLNIDQPGVVLRGVSGQRSRVVLQGEGMQERQVGVALAVGASGVTLADLTIRNFGLHGIQVRGENGVANVQIHNVHVQDAGQQLLKGSLGDGSQRSKRCLVACSRFEYTDYALGSYTNGVDVLGGIDWHVRDNYFVRIRGPERNRGAGPAVLFWRNSKGTIVERNTVLDCFRGIALGLTDDPGDTQRAGAAYFDHEGGIIRNNVVANLHRWADEGIEVNAARGVTIDHNTVFVQGKMPWSISIRFAASSAIVRNNLTNRPIAQRDRGRFTAQGNIPHAVAAWFVSPGEGDFRLRSAGLEPVDAAVSLEVEWDAAGKRRPTTQKADVGAFEFQRGES
jgi:hypothetical protein